MEIRDVLSRVRRLVEMAPSVQLRNFGESVPCVSHKLEVFPGSYPYGTGTVGKYLTRSKRWAVHFRYRIRSLEVTALYLWVP